MQLSNNTVSSDPNFFAQLAPGTGSAGGSGPEADATGDGTQFEAVIAEIEETSPAIGDDAATAAAQSGVWVGQLTPPPPIACVGVMAPDGEATDAATEAVEPAEVEGTETGVPGFPPGRARGLGHGIKNENALQHAAAATHLAPGLQVGPKASTEVVESTESTTAAPVPADRALLNGVGNGRVTSSREIGRFDPTTGLGRAALESLSPDLGGGQMPVSSGDGTFPGKALFTATPSAQAGTDPRDVASTLPSAQAAENSAVDALVAAGITVKELGAARGLKSALDAATAITDEPETAMMPDGTMPELISTIAAPPPAGPIVARNASARVDGVRSHATPANSAVSVDAVVADEAELAETSDKSFVSADGQSVEPGRKRLGIDSAKTGLTMFARYQPPAVPHPASDYAAAAIAPVASGLDAASAPEKALEAQAVSSAHEAVEVVLQAASQAESREQKSVSLQFRVGDADLSVRVELRADQVRTTFRTDSTDLRNALSHEWQSVSASASSGDRHLRIAPAVFTSSDQSATHDGSSNDASSRQREQHAQRELAENAFAGLRQQRGTANVVALPSSTPTVQPALGGRRSLHLHTHA